MHLDLSILVLFIASVVAFLGTPGPVTLLVVNTSLKAGLSDSMRTIIGTNTASLVLITISALVILGMIALDEKVLTVLKIFGSIYLLYCAYTLVKEVLKKNPIGLTTQKSVRGSFKKGFAIGISNPKDIIFFVSFFPQFINLTPSKITSLICLTMVWIVLDYSILTVYACVSKKIITPKFKQLFFCISAGLFLIIGMWSIISSFYSFTH